MEKDQISQTPMDALKEAVRQVNAAIDATRKRLEEIADGEEEPVFVEGETSVGCLVHTFVDPSVVARIMLRYDYPVWDVLGEDAPDEMWREIAHALGIASVLSVDLGIKPIEKTAPNTKTD